MRPSVLYRIQLLAAVVTISGPAASFGQPARSTGAAPAAALDDVPAEWLHWTSGRYRIMPGDVLEFRFPSVPELDQTVTVQPDGFVSLQELEDVKVQGRTLDQIKDDVREAYTPVLREPLFTLALRQFEKPYFIAGGEVETPGRYELRGATTLTQALAFAGGTRAGADLSEVLLVRRTADRVEVKEVNVKRMLARRDLDEDPLLRPGDMIVVGKSVIGKLSPIFSVFRWGY